jgi:hypothetical protein
MIETCGIDTTAETSPFLTALATCGRTGFPSTPLSTLCRTLSGSIASSNVVDHFRLAVSRCAYRQITCQSRDQVINPLVSTVVRVQGSRARLLATLKSVPASDVTRRPRRPRAIRDVGVRAVSLVAIFCVDLRVSLGVTFRIVALPLSLSISGTAGRTAA